MADAVAKLLKARAEKAKTYKVSHDVDRARSLAHLGHLLRDYPAHAALASSVSRELAAMNAKQAELDAKETEENSKELAEAMAADSNEGNKESPPTRAKAKESVS